MLSEPTVLARAKEFMLPSSGSSGDTIRYATVDTQFRKDAWPNAGPIKPEIRETLAPFNHVPLGSGYPDMVLAGPAPEFLKPLQVQGDAHPVIAIEAKGETRGQTGTNVAVETALLQAHDRMSESNASLVAVPSNALTERTRQLGRELDVGILSVSDSEVSVLEPPVLKGVATNETASAVRWQASAQRIADQSFHYNHPKTYLGIALALASEFETRTIFESKIASAGFRSGKHGARFLGLVRTDPKRDLTLTPLGKEVVRFASRTHGSVDGALTEMETWGGKGSQTDLIDRHEGWGEFTRQILFQYPITPFIIETVEEETQSVTGSDDSTSGPTLPELVQSLYAKRPVYTVEIFIRQKSDSRERVFKDDNTLSSKALTSTEVYQSTTVYQYKMLLRHSGILHPDVTAHSTDTLSPETDYWTLRNKA